MAYNVYRSTQNGSGYTKIGSTTTQLAYADTSVAYGTTYYYVVTAVDAAGESGYSNQTIAVIP
jgi:fibronectin type 3 domain-containing protein